MKKKPAPTIRELYPHMSEEELRVAAENLDQYLILVAQIYERICSDPAECAKFLALTRKTPRV